MSIPADLKYTAEHEWIRVEGDEIVVGVTEFAQGELGDVVFIELETEGETLAKGETFGTIEAVKTVSDLYMPVDGEVVKVNPAIMGKNWVHLQDGSRYGGNVDITITTNDVVKVNDVATFEGVVILDKDFGYGYAYDILVEEAKLIDLEGSTSLQ